MNNKERYLTKVMIDNLFILNLDTGALCWRINKGSTASINWFNRVTPRGRDSQHRGVRLSRNKLSWEARIQVKGVQIYLGSFTTEIAAAVARRAAEIKYFEEYAPC